MAEELKEKILEFLKENREEKFVIKAISQRLKISYPTTLKWVEVLIGERKISVEDFGNIKFVKYK